MRKTIILAAACAAVCMTAPADATYGVSTLGVESAFRALHSGRCLDNNGSTANWATVVQRSCNGSSSQQWRFISVGTNVVQLRNAASGKCLDVPAFSTANGTALIQYDCNGLANQQWLLVPGNAGAAFATVKIVSVHDAKCVDVGGVSLDDGAAVVQWDCIVGQRNQDWEPV